VDLKNILQVISWKKSFQAALIALGIALLAGVLLSQSLSSCVLLFFFAMAGQVALVFNELNQQTQRKMKHLICNAPVIMHKVIMLIHGGTHPQNSLIEGFGELHNDPWIGKQSQNFVAELRAGIYLEGAILNFNLDLKYKPLGRMLQRISLYEKTGNILLLQQLSQDLIALDEEKYDFLIEQMNQADLLSILPSLIHLLILMILLMSPMLLGGIGGI
jgi:Flp pilus assembly protein TadB